MDLYHLNICMWSICLSLNTQSPNAAAAAVVFLFLSHCHFCSLYFYFCSLFCCLGRPLNCRNRTFLHLTSLMKVRTDKARPVSTPIKMEAGRTVSKVFPFFVLQSRHIRIPQVFFTINFDVPVYCSCYFLLNRELIENFCLQDMTPYP